MATFDKITVEDFNRVQNKVADILGVGSGSYGYGQAVLSSPATADSKVSVAAWTLLQYDIINISRKQNGTIPTIPLPAQNNKIKFNSTTEPVNTFELFVAGIENSRFNIPATSLGDTLWATKSFTGSWNATLTFFVDVNFPSANVARYFFNLGGKIRITASRSGGTDSGGNTTIKLQNESWTQLLDTVDAQFGGAPTTISDSLDGSNFYRCKNTYVDAFYTVQDDSPYQNNSLKISASTPTDTDNRDGSANYVQLRVELIDAHKQINKFAVADGVDGTVSIVVETIDPTGRAYPSNNVYTQYSPSSITVTDGIATSVVNYP